MLRNKSVRSVNLKRGSGEAIIIVNGKNLNKVTSIKVLNARGVTASFKIISATKLQVTLKAIANAKIGNYQLRVKAGKHFTNIPTSIVRVGVTVPLTQRYTEQYPLITPWPENSADRHVAVMIKKVFSPKSGAVWRRGQSYSVQWKFKIESSGGRIDLTIGKEIDIDLVGSNGQKIVDIVDEVGLRSYQWTVPNDLVSGNYRIVVTVASKYVARSEVFFVSSKVPLTVRLWSYYDVNKVWLCCEPGGEPYLVIPDLSPLIPFNEEAAEGDLAPRYDTSKVIEVPQGTLCNLEYVQARIVNPTQQFCSNMNTWPFRAGEERVPGSTILRETITIFDHQYCGQTNWARVEQILRAPNGKVYRYLIYDAARALPSTNSENPILLEEILAQGYKLYDSNEFKGKYEPYSATQY